MLLLFIMPNQLSIELLRLFAKGELAGTQLQTLAMAACQDGWGHDDALAFMLAHAGSAGKRRGAVATEVIEAAESLGIICNDSHPYYVKLHDAGLAQMYLPHEVFTDMVARSDLARWCLTPDQLSTEQGLGKLLKDWGDHPDVEFAEDLGSVAILGMHMDGVQYTSSLRAGGARGILVASVNVVSAQSNSDEQVRQPLLVLRKSRLCSVGAVGTTPSSS